MAKLQPQLQLPRCPHCNVNNPNLAWIHHCEAYDHSGQILRRWGIYKCANCGYLVTAWAINFGEEAIQVFPEPQFLDELIPERPRTYLHQAIESLHSPAGAVMLAASSVDSMLKMKGYKENSLYSRIEQAAKDHLITVDMAKWAHDVRLDANDQRHADDNAPLPSVEDAKRCIDFAQALAQFIFVLPARVQRGIAEAGAGI